MSWQAHLRLAYRREDERTLCQHRHEGPLRILKALYPEGPGVCHHVLVHPPAGLVGGDLLDIDLELGPGSHAVLTTPGATRFYRSSGATAEQRLQARLGTEARLEWLPQENLIYNAAQALNHQHFALAAGASMMGWDVLSLGLPAAGQPFASGRVTQHLEIADSWLDRAVIDAGDTRLLDSPLGWAGHRSLATMWFAWGSAPPSAVLQRAVDAAREALAALPEMSGGAGKPAGVSSGPSAGNSADISAGISAAHPGCVVLRALAHQVEPAMQLLRAVRRRWRAEMWALPSDDLRLWRT